MGPPDPDRAEAPPRRRHPEILDDVHLRLWSHLQPMPAPQRDAVLESLDDHFGGSGPPNPSDCRMNSVEIAALADSPLATLGAHTVNHPILARLARREQRAEVADSVRLLSEIAGDPVTRFSYPFGGPDDFTQTSSDVVRDAGLVLACSNQAGSGFA